MFIIFFWIPFRELAAYDPRNMSKRIHTEKLSTSSSTALLFADEDANLLFVAGKVLSILPSNN